MKESYEVYRDAVRDVWRDWWTAWPLSQSVHLGDVFHLTDSRVRPAGALSDRGVTFASRGGTPHNDYLYATQGSAAVRFKTAGVAMDGVTALAVADLGALVTFEKDDSALIVYRGLVENGVTDERAIAAALVRLTWETWDDSLLAVTHVIAAESGTVLTAAGTSASAELRLQAGAGQAQLGLADVAGRVSVARAKGLGLHWTSDQGCTPFFRVVGLRKGWFGKVKQDYGPRQPGRGAGPVPVPPALVDEAHEDPRSVIEVLGADDQPFGITDQ